MEIALRALLASEPAPPAGAEVARLTALLRECNAVCLCGCPESEHESYGEDGESCGNDDHECLRVPRAVLAYAERLRSAAPPPSDAVREAAEDVVRGDWWGHYCPSCGSTFKHGPECRIGRLAEALSSARAAASHAPGSEAVREAAEAKATALLGSARHYFAQGHPMREAIDEHLAALRGGQKGAR